MDINTSRNILGKDFFPNFFSADHVIYYSEAIGLVQGAGMGEPSVNEYQRMGLGKDGYSYEEQTYQNMPWSLSIEYQEPINRFLALMQNENPDDVESEDSGSDVVLIGGSNALNEAVDIVINQINRDNDKFVKSFVYLNSTKNVISNEVPNENSSTCSIGGNAKRGFLLNKPVKVEGIGHVCAVEPAAVPDDTVVVGRGHMWLRRTAADFATTTPRKAFFKGDTSDTFNVVPAASPEEPRYDALVAYETVKDGYSDIVLTIVEGTEAVAPDKVLDATIEAAVDALVADARWCRVADIYVDEPVTVVINTADIELVEIPSLTTYLTAIQPTAKHKRDAALMWTYVLQCKQDGIVKDNLTNIASQTSTVITFSIALPDGSFEVIYMTEPRAKWNELQV